MLSHNLPSTRSRGVLNAPMQARVIALWIHFSDNLIVAAVGIIICHWLNETFMSYVSSFFLQKLVDFRASCFCHRRPVEFAFMCSVCLALTCELPEVSCSTCSTLARKPVVKNDTTSREAIKSKLNSWSLMVPRNFKARHIRQLLHHIIRWRQYYIFILRTIRCKLKGTLACVTTMVTILTNFFRYFWLLSRSNFAVYKTEEKFVLKYEDFGGEVPGRNLSKL